MPNMLLERQNYKFPICRLAGSGERELGEVVTRFLGSVLTPLMLKIFLIRILTGGGLVSDCEFFPYLKASVAAVSLQSAPEILALHLLQQMF